MSNFLDSLPGWALVVGIAALWAALAIGLLLLSRRFIAPERLEVHNDVVGFVFAGISVIYAVLLAFLVIGVWENHEEQRRLIDEEAAHLIALYRLGNLIDGAETTKAATKRYAELVVSDEWPHLKRGELSGKTDEALHAIAIEAGSVAAFKTGGGWSDLFVQDLHEVRMTRTHRATAVASSLPGVLWLALIAGGVITVGYVALYGMRHILVHAIITAALAALVGISIGLVFVLDAPYRGPDGIDPEPFVRVIALMDV